MTPTDSKGTNQNPFATQQKGPTFSNKEYLERLVMVGIGIYGKKDSNSTSTDDRLKKISGPVLVKK